MKKNPCTPINRTKIFMLWPKKIHTRNLITKKNSCGSKIPHPPHNFSNGPSLISSRSLYQCYFTGNIRQLILTPFCGYCGFLWIRKKTFRPLSLLNSSRMRFCKNNNAKSSVTGAMARTKAKTRLGFLFLFGCCVSLYRAVSV